MCVYVHMYVYIIQWIQNLVLGLFSGMIFYQLEDDGPNVFLDRCVLICACIHMYLCICMCVFVCMCMHVHIILHVCMCLYVCEV